MPSFTPSSCHTNIEQTSAEVIGGVMAYYLTPYELLEKGLTSRMFYHCWYHHRVYWMEALKNYFPGKYESLINEAQPEKDGNEKAIDYKTAFVRASRQLQRELILPNDTIGIWIPLPVRRMFDFLSCTFFSHSLPELKRKFKDYISDHLNHRHQFKLLEVASTRPILFDWLISTMPLSSEMVGYFREKLPFEFKNGDPQILKKLCHKLSLTPSILRQLMTQQDIDGQTALHRAVAHPELLQTVLLLANFRATRPNILLIPDLDQETPFHRALAEPLSLKILLSYFSKEAIENIIRAQPSILRVAEKTYPEALPILTEALLTDVRPRSSTN